MVVLYIYLFLINVFAVLITVHDKKAAERHRRRVSEKTLFFVAAIGGALGMYLTMLTIRHKTRKPLFMRGIPIVFLLECAVVLVLHFGFKVI